MKYPLKVIMGAVMMCMLGYVHGQGGSTYIRWGRTSCCSGSTLVYAGYAGGSSHKNTGGGANYICLTASPVYKGNAPGAGRALVYGAEYENAYSPATDDFDVPCAVCEAPRCATFMLPGSDACPTGWTTEYSGWLSAMYFGYQRTEFVCVDEEAENGGSISNQNGALFYPAQGVCGSLPCGPYINGRDLTCAVCSK